MYSVPHSNQMKDTSLSSSLQDDKALRLQSKIAGARNQQRSSKRGSMRGSMRRTSLSSSTKDKAPHRNPLEDSVRDLHPHQIIDLLEVSARDDRDASFMCLQTIKNATSMLDDKPRRKRGPRRQCSSDSTYSSPH
ncbi:expressed unknown protein [Seminavis robusta]|uniref:Uncharacterized protein n=1 Tax=Seminavis robusta TaxID=568900 RepID=A0A9N8DR66_9STRA|nr:expressed unknown protein [Seminavis robusta]|eukprot:Sro197_g083790.1 n/a (135) ;mRNA; r:38719-39123